MTRRQHRPKRGYLPRGPTAKNVAPAAGFGPNPAAPPERDSAHAAPTPDDGAADPASSSWKRVEQALIQFGLLATCLIAAALPLLRVTRLVSWSWGWAFAPFTAIGIGGTGMMTSLMLRGQRTAKREALAGAVGSALRATPAPETLAPPRHAVDADEAILAEHPELLAALCHGFRKLPLSEAVLGRPVTDPWAVYEAAVAAPTIDLFQLRWLARKHVERFAGRARGRRPPEAQVMKRAIEAFQKCAERSLNGRVDPDCPFEHIVVVFGTQSSPNRDVLLASVVPKVRVLLERQYPQLATARLGDGSHVKYDEWNKQAARDRSELARLQRDHERLTRSLDETSSRLEAARERATALENAAEASRREARAAARAEQERLTEELRANFERACQEHARELQRVECERDRLLEAVDELSSERDLFQRLVFTGSDDEPDEGPAPTDGLAGLRVLLVGGEAAQVPPIREHLEAQGIQLVQQDGASAADLVTGAHLVVLWIRYVSHPTAFTIKRECRSRRVPLTYWTRTSPPSLVALIARASAAAREAGGAVVDP